MTKHKCTECGKEHDHYHICFADGSEIFRECKACCPICNKQLEEVVQDAKSR